MITIYSEKHRLRNAKTELFGGLLVPPYENPSRADIVLERVNSEKLGEVIAPREFAMEPVLALHDAEFVEFLQVAWEDGLRQNTKVKLFPPAGRPAVCPSEDRTILTARLATMAFPLKPQSAKAHGKQPWPARMSL